MAREKREMIRRILLVMSAISLVVSGCGGGTTGTSSTGELKLLGTGQTASGSPLTDAPMTVYSAQTDDELLASETDERGSFEMSLPATEQTLVVEVAGKKTSPLVRSYSGSSVLSTALLQESSGNIRFSTVVEARIDTTSLCSSLKADNNSLIIVKQVEGDSCEISLDTSSQGNDDLLISGQVRSECGGQELITDSNSALSDGSIQLTIDLSDTAMCLPKEVVISTDSDDVPPISIPIR